MKIYQLLLNQDLTVAVEVDRGLLDLSSAFQTYNFVKRQRMMVKVQSILDFLQYPDFPDEIIIRVLDFIEAHNLWDRFLIQTDYKILAPIQRPGKIIAIGLNYVAHVHESAREVPTEPVFFDKAGSVVIGQDDAIEIPPGAGRVDHELELAVVIKKAARNIHPDNYSQFIAGLTIFNDVTARDLQKLAKTKQLPWFRSKNFDTFGPMGPCLVTFSERKELAEVLSLDMELRINGVVRQKSNTANMIFKIPDLMAYITKSLTLYPGDLISTGTPEGIGELNAGDIIEAEIDRIGILRNKVVLKEEKQRES